MRGSWLGESRYSFHRAVAPALPSPFSSASNWLRRPEARPVMSSTTSSGCMQLWEGRISARWTVLLATLTLLDAGRSWRKRRVASALLPPSTCPCLPAAPPKVDRLLRPSSCRVALLIAVRRAFRVVFWGCCSAVPSGLARGQGATPIVSRFDSSSHLVAYSFRRRYSNRATTGLQTHA